MKQIFDQVSIETSKNTTRSYSTSFSLGIRFLNKEIRNPIYAIYGYVRFADEIVDTFNEYDKKYLLDKFREDTYEALEQRISLNPILNSFQWAVNKYNIPLKLIDTFLDSMEMDLGEQNYDRNTYEKYILGSAEVVGLMCLKVFVKGDQEIYDRLKPNAMKLGSAFQKINFLRDLEADVNDLGRMYFPHINMEQFCELTKVQIEKEIEEDFEQAFIGIKGLPKSSRFGVYVAYVYYSRLLKKIKKVPAERILQERIRIPNERKFTLFVGSYVKHSLNLI